jgi:hypothetical protein
MHTQGLWQIASVRFQGICSNMTLKQQGREKIARIEVPAAAFRPDQVFRVILFMGRLHTHFAVCDATKITFRTFHWYSSCRLV